MFQKATKYGAKLRLAMFGPSGSGKTFTALRLATGLGGRIAVVCTERGSARKYSDRFSFDVCDLADRTIDGYTKALQSASGYDVLIIDSITHAWQELLEEIDKLAKTKFRGNKWTAWSEGTPKQHDFIDELLSFPGHLIVTMRSKTEWETTNQDGKVKPVRVGLSPEQGKGIEYEFDLLIELSTEHIATIIKDRTGRWQDAIIEKPDESLGRELATWLADGDLPPPVERPPLRSAAASPRAGRSAANPPPPAVSSERF